MLFRAEGVVTAAGSRHVQASCRDYTAQENLCGLYGPCAEAGDLLRHPHPRASVSVPHSSRYTRGSKDEKQLGFTAAKTDHKSCTSSLAEQQHVDRNVPCVSM